MIRFFILILFLCISRPVLAQYPPSVGQPGCNAMHKDSTAFIAWASNCVVNRGFQDISNTSLGLTSVGDSSSALNQADGVNVISLGDGGSAVLTFDVNISDGPESDFAVFENGFSDDFLELAFVEVSSDGLNYFRFPSVSLTQDSLQTGPFGSTEAHKIYNLAGKYRALYGTPFDLQDLNGVVGLNCNAVTHIKVVDVVGALDTNYRSVDSNGKSVNDPWPTPFASGGFDLDAVGVIHSNQIGITEQVVMGLAIYPNPFASQVTLKSSSKCSVRLINIQGELLWSAILNKEEKHEFGQELPSGTYFLVIINEEKSVVQRIIKYND